MKNKIKEIVGLSLSTMGFVGFFAVSDRPILQAASLIVSTILVLAGVYLLSSTELWKNTSNEA